MPIIPRSQSEEYESEYHGERIQHIHRGLEDDGVTNSNSFHENYSGIGTESANGAIQEEEKDEERSEVFDETLIQDHHQQQQQQHERNQPNSDEQRLSEHKKCSYCGHRFHHNFNPCTTLVKSEVDFCVTCDCKQDLDVERGPHCQGPCRNYYMVYAKMTRIYEWLDFLDRKYETNGELRSKCSDVLSDLTFGDFTYLALLGNRDHETLRNILNSFIESQQHVDIIQSECEKLFGSREHQFWNNIKDNKEKYDEHVEKYLILLGKRIYDGEGDDDDDDNLSDTVPDVTERVGSQEMHLSEIRQCKCQQCTCRHCPGKIPCQCIRCSCGVCQQQITDSYRFILVAIIILFTSLFVMICSAAVVLLFQFLFDFEGSIFIVVSSSLLFCICSLLCVSSLGYSLISTIRILTYFYQEYDPLQEEEKRQRMKEQKRNDSGIGDTVILLA